LFGEKKIVDILKERLPEGLLESALRQQQIKFRLTLSTRIHAGIDVASCHIDPTSSFLQALPPETLRVPRLISKRCAKTHISSTGPRSPRSFVHKERFGQ